MSETTEWLNALTPWVLAIIPYFFQRDKKAGKRAEKVWNLVEPKIQQKIEEYHNNENLTEIELVRYFNFKKILNDTFLDLEADNFFKKKLLNNELNEIFAKTEYKYVYNKITAKDLDTLNIIGKSWNKWYKIFKKPEENNILFLPTYALLDSESVTLDNPRIKTKSSTDLIYSVNSIFNVFKYNNSIFVVLNKYNDVVDSIFNLITLGLVIYQMDDDYFISSIDIEELYEIKPFALSLTNKGKKIYDAIKND